jgi:predicted SAM-dependent methyltransferase
MKKRNRLKPLPPALLKLDLACGQTKQDGFLGVDRVPLDGVDQVVNLEAFPWPWKDASVEVVHCSHYVEHTPDLIAFMNELGRILIPGGTAQIIAPYYTSMRAWQDPTHVRAISEATFLYFNKDWRVSQKLDHYPITCDFDYSYGYAMAPEWAVRSQEARDFAIRHYWNVVNDLHVTLTRK